MVYSSTALLNLHSLFVRAVFETPHVTRIQEPTMQKKNKTQLKEAARDMYLKNM